MVHKYHISRVALVNPTTSLNLPAAPDRRKSPRLQLLDTGLLAYFAGLQGELLLAADLNQVFRGKIAEHIVGQEILSSDPSALHKLSFWVRDKKQSSAEVDFVVSCSHGLIPVEVKAGASGRMRSLHQFMDKSDHIFAVRLYAERLRIDKVKTIAGKPFYLLSLPYYLAGQLNMYIEWFINKVK